MYLVHMNVISDTGLINSLMVTGGFMIYVLIGAGILVSAVLAVQVRRLLISAIWLALTSALVAVLLYLLEAPQIAVIELSVGAGLVTVLFVFAINISGEDTARLRSIIKKPVAVGAVVLAGSLAIFFIIRSTGIIQLPESINGDPQILWNERYLDFLLQIVLIFSGVLGVIGLLANGNTSQPEEEEE